MEIGAYVKFEIYGEVKCAKVIKIFENEFEVEWTEFSTRVNEVVRKRKRFRYDSTRYRLHVPLKKKCADFLKVI